MLYLYFLLYIVYLIIYRKNKTVGVSPGVGGHISDGARQGAGGQNTSVEAQCCSRVRC
jgi:hypothetical protein